MFFKRKRRLWSEGAEPVPDQPVPAPKQKLGWLDRRDQRRRRRKMFEEVLGWILVPAFVYGIYLAIKAVGGVPKELVAFSQELIQLATKGGH